MILTLLLKMTLFNNLEKWLKCKWEILYQFRLSFTYGNGTTKLCTVVLVCTAGTFGFMPFSKSFNENNWHFGWCNHKSGRESVLFLTFDKFSKLSNIILGQDLDEYMFDADFKNWNEKVNDCK